MHRTSKNQEKNLFITKLVVIKLDANLKKKCSDGEFIRFFWKAASAKSVGAFNEAIECMRAIDAEAIEWILTSSPPQHWATAHFEGKRFGHLAPNIGDALNSWQGIKLSFQCWKSLECN